MKDMEKLSRLHRQREQRLAQSAFYSMAQVIIKLGLSRILAYRLANSGELPGVVRLGRVFRVRKAVLDAFIDGSKEGGER